MAAPDLECKRLLPQTEAHFLTLIQLHSEHKVEPSVLEGQAGFVLLTPAQRPVAYVLYECDKDANRINILSYYTVPDMRCQGCFAYLVNAARSQATHGEEVYLEVAATYECVLPMLRQRLGFVVISDEEHGTTLLKWTAGAPLQARRDIVMSDRAASSRPGCVVT